MKDRKVPRSVSYGANILAAAVVLLSGAAAGLPAAAGAAAQVVHAPAQARSLSYVGASPEKSCNGVVSTTSSNWGGYAIQSCLTDPSKDVATHVAGTWVEPTVKCKSGQTAYAAFWVGIDGYSSSSVEQLGTDSDCNSGSPSYYAWYEMYPAAPVNFKLTISPGNKITASVSYSSSSGKFTLSIKDVTTGKSASISKSAKSAARSSAEWIVEAPSSGSGVLPLADFGKVTFSSCSATLSGTAGPIQTSSSTWQAAEMNIVGSKTEETTSALNSGGNGFTGTWNAS
jgi:hypothetical protein